VVVSGPPRGLPPAECGQLEYLRRPFSRDELWARVGVLLRLRAANRELAERTAALEQSNALAASRARLAALDRARDDLFRLMSREIRTPLNGVFGVGELLIDQCGPEGDLGRAEELSQLFRASRARVSTVLENAELLCRIETRNFASSRLSLSVLTRGALTGLTPQEAAHVEVTEGPERLVLGDKALLEHGLRALLRTALRFARESPVRLRWTVESDATLLEIEARGDQAPPNLLAVFFEVVGAARAPTAGRELGLDPTVAHRVLSIFGAQLVAQNVAGGLRLSVWLPAPQPHLHQET
jgi:K+-sensing histidine kinase KdpD